MNTNTHDGGRMAPRTGSGGVRAARLAYVLALSALIFVAGCSFPPSRSGSGAGTLEIVSHAVSSGETLSSIADDYYGTPDGASYLADVNDIDADIPLEPGAVVEIPVGAEDIERYRRRTEAKIFYNRGTVLAGGGDYARAEEEFSTALRADPRFVDAAYNLGVVLLASGEPERAAAILETALLVKPDEPLYEFALGKAHFDAGRAAAALSHFERSLDLDPGLEDALFARAVTLLKLGRRDEGVFALDSYVREFPEGTWVDGARAELEELARAGETTP